MNYKLEIKCWGVWFAMLGLVLLMVSCKTKHKVIERETVKEENKKEATINEINENDITVKNETNIVTDFFKTSNTKEIKLKQADNNKTITITDETGKTLSIKGANVIVKKTKTTEKQKDTIAILGSSIDKSKTTTATNTKESSKKDNTKRTSDSDVKTTSTWLWIIILLIILFAAGYYIKKKTSLLG